MIKSDSLSAVVRTHDHDSSGCYLSFHLFPSPVVTLFRSYITLSSRPPSSFKLHEQPGRAVWGALVGSVRCPPPFLSPDPLNPATFQVSNRSYTFRTTPFTGNPVALVVSVGSLLVSSYLAGTHEPSLCPGPVGFTEACLASLFGSVGFSVSF